MIDDLKHYRAPKEDDGFQLIDPDTAGALFWIGLIVLILVNP